MAAGGWRARPLLIAGAMVLGITLGALGLWRRGTFERLHWREVELQGRRYLEHAPEAAAPPRALLVVLHAYDTSPLAQERFFRLRQEARANGWLLVLPEGTLDSNGKRFWNAGPACCAFDPNPPDDVRHLLAVLADVRRRHALPPTVLTYALGVSNGAFMAHRLACEPEARLAGVLSVSGTATAGAGSADGTCARPPEVALLHVHGTADDVIRFEGGALPGRAPYAPAEVLVEEWASRSGCGDPRSEARLDFDTRVDGQEAERTTFTGCRANEVTRVRVEGGGHQLRPTAPARALMHGFLRGEPPPGHRP